MTLMHWMWIAIGVIGITAVIKTAVLISRRRNERNNTSDNRNRVHIPVETSVSSATETGPMVYFANDRHGLNDREYRFNYKKVGGSWRAYILRMPSLGSRSSDGHSTHRHWDGNKPYVCWKTNVKSLNDMQVISRAWADGIQEYIATGKTFG